MPELTVELLERHTAVWRQESRTLACSCGDVTGYVSHIGALLGTDEACARGALLAAHDNVEVSAGMCGGCDACGSASAAVHCPICGDASDPCLTYFVAAGRGPTDTEGLQ